MVIKFTDPYLEMYIRQILNETDGDILLSDVEKIENLNAWHKEITNLEGIQYFKGLKTLKLGYNIIEDISPLSEMTELEELYLNGNIIKDISPLKNLKKLKVLNISCNMIQDLSPIQDLIDSSECEVYMNQYCIREECEEEDPEETGINEK